MRHSLPVKTVSLRLPGLWPLMYPLTLLANGRRCTLSLCDAAAERWEKIGTCWPHDSSTDSPRDYFANLCPNGHACAALSTSELQGVALQNDNSMLRMQCGLGSYSCCDNLLGILLRHPSRAAATRGRNVGTSERIHAPSCDFAFLEQPTHYQVRSHAPRGRPP